MKPNKPANTPETGPVRKSGTKIIKGNPTKKGKIFGNWQKRGGKKNA